MNEVVAVSLAVSYLKAKLSAWRWPQQELPPESLLEDIVIEIMKLGRLINGGR